MQCGAAGHIAVQLFMCLSMPFDLQLKARSAAAGKLPQSEAACMLWFKYACCSRGLPLQPWPLCRIYLTTTCHALQLPPCDASFRSLQLSCRAGSIACELSTLCPAVEILWWKQPAKPHSPCGPALTLTAIQRLFNSSELSDCRFVVDGRHIPAHR